MPKSANEIWREFVRFTGDGLPGAPVGQPLPIGDPSSGVWNPSKKDIRDWANGFGDQMEDLVALAEMYAERAEGAADQASNGDALILWTGQSNAVQPFDSGGTADTIAPNVTIWHNGAFVPLAPGVGGVSADATRHSLFNFTRRMRYELGYPNVRVINVSEGGRPIAEWTGTPGNRAISTANTPQMQKIKDAMTAAGAGKFTHVVMIQGEANALDAKFPWDEPGTYGYERLYFRSSLIAQGFADAKTAWLDVELLRRDVASASWRANDVISRLDETGYSNSAVVSSYGFVGEDEGLSMAYAGGAVTVPYRLHFSAADNSELGHRLFHAASKLETKPPAQPDKSFADLIAPDGRLGFKPPFLHLTDATQALSSYWARGGIVRITGNCTLTLGREDLRTGFIASAGSNIKFMIDIGATLTLNVAPLQIYARPGFTNTLVRKGGGGEAFLELLWDGSNWQIVHDIGAGGNVGGPGGNYWEISPGGTLSAWGQAGVGRTAGNTVDVTFNAAMPAITGTSGLILASGAAVAINRTATGFRLVRAATIDAAVDNQVVWHLMGAALA